MKISSGISFQNTSTANSFQNIMNNLNYEHKKTLKQALMQIPGKELPKILKELNKIPVDEHYIKNLINFINTNMQKNNNEGFLIYA